MWVARPDRCERGGTNRFLTAEKTDVNRCRSPADRKPCIVHSRFRSGTCEFSTLLFSLLWDRCSTLGMGLIGAFVGGLLFLLFGLFPGLDAVTISLRDIVAACAGSLLVLIVLWGWERSRRAVNRRGDLRRGEDGRREPTQRVHDREPGQEPHRRDCQCQRRTRRWRHCSCSPRCDLRGSVALTLAV
jgi:uncharacterized membrane protein YeaQ/YmgE (transglycosylase-associated protein family)